MGLRGAYTTIRAPFTGMSCAFFATPCYSDVQRHAEHLRRSHDCLASPVCMLTLNRDVDIRQIMEPLIFLAPLNHIGVGLEQALEVLETAPPLHDAQ